MRLKLVVYFWDGQQFLGPFERYSGPVGQRIVLADSRVTLYGPHDRITLDSPFAYRINLEPGNPRLDKVVDDPSGTEYPCFSIGWGDGWWSNPRYADSNLYAVTLDIERPGNIGIDFALWDNAARGAGRQRIHLLNGNTGQRDEQWNWILEDLENNPLRIEPWSEFPIVTGIAPEPTLPGPAPAPDLPAWNPPPGAIVMRGWLETGGTFETFWTEDGRHWSALPS